MGPDRLIPSCSASHQGLDALDWLCVEAIEAPL
jgi:hypothetical protein